MSVGFPDELKEAIGFLNCTAPAYRRPGQQACCEPRQPLRVIRSVQRPLVRIPPCQAEEVFGSSISSKVIRR
jgi:hypothetical protein